MEHPKTIDHNEYISIYFQRVLHYTTYGVIIGGLASRLFFMKFRTGALMGFGTGLGYCHEDLVNTYHYFKKQI